MLVISEDFRGNRIYAVTYRYLLSSFIPSYELALCIFCILFMSGDIEKIHKNSKPCEVGVSSRVGENVSVGGDEGA